ncbi:serine hydrolase domain-containing protein [Acidisarcina polymorpha]|uniref:serine hydrolase domain-containing protein n=1 Tax=Acidisarcina polymorpha TaxID=2211140 RepID=UPI000DEEFC9D|nr:serine hydrolase [Acidisarcina polymorpha]
MSAQQYVPGVTWRQASPESQGVASKPLIEMLQYIRQHRLPVHDIMIVRHGYLVFEASFYPYNPEWPHDLASVTKSVTSILTGIAIDQGLIKSPQQTVGSLLPQYADRLDSSQKSAITIRDLLTMTSGLDCKLEDGEKALKDMQQSSDWAAFALSLRLVDEPGSRFSYCSPNLHLLSVILTTQARQSELNFARRNLFLPLQIRDATWGADPQGRNTGWGGLHLKPRDMAKLGYLYLQAGQWGSHQVVSSAWTQASVQPLVPVRTGVAYGYNWWINTEHTPPIFEAEGRGGQRIVVIRDKDSVITFLGGGVDTDELAPFLLRALSADQSLPPNPAAQKQLKTLLKAAREAPPPRTFHAAGPTTALSGKTLIFEQNPMRLESMTFHFDRTESLALTIGLEGKIYTIPVGSKGRSIISSTGPFGLPFAAQGGWDQGGRFILDLDTLANINHYTIRIDVNAERPFLIIDETTGELHEYRLAARFKAD